MTAATRNPRHSGPSRRPPRTSAPSSPCPPSPSSSWQWPGPPQQPPWGSSWCHRCVRGRSSPSPSMAACPRPCNRSPPCCSPWTYSLVSRLPGAVVGSLEVLDTRPGHSAPATCSLDTENVAARSDIRPAASASE